MTIMKRFILSAFLCAVCLTLAAQSPQLSQLSTSKATHCNVSFVARHGEAFTVFIDGDPMNRMPQGRVIVNDISQQVHEIVVVLRRPAEKAAVMRFIPGEPNAVVNVDYDEKSGYLHLFTAPCNRPDAPSASRERLKKPLAVGAGKQSDKPQLTAVEKPSVATDEDVETMVRQLKAEPFDSDRLALARTLLSSSLFSSEQIARLVQTIDYSNSQVELLKYAYNHCHDPRNYSTAIEVLTFTADRKKVTDYIATQH